MDDSAYYSALFFVIPNLLSLMSEKMQEHILFLKIITDKKICIYLWYTTCFDACTHWEMDKSNI
jgi:hypothetical protein